MKEKILLVEDHPEYYQYLKSVLEKNEYEVSEFIPTAQHAQEYLLHNKPSLALVDIELADKQFSGLKVGEYLTNHTNIPFAYLTNHEEDALYEKAKQNSAYKMFIYKTSSEIQLIRHVDTIIFGAKNVHLDKHGLEVHIYKSENGDLVYTGEKGTVPFSIIRKMQKHRIKTKKNYVLFFTEKSMPGKQQILRIALKELYRLLPTFFGQPNKSCILNLKRVTTYQTGEVTVGTYSEKVTRTYAKEFFTRLKQYFR